MQQANICIIEDKYKTNRFIVGVRESVLTSCIVSSLKFLGATLHRDWGWDGAHIYGSPNHKLRYANLSFADIIKEILEAEKTLGPEFGGDSILFLNKVGERKYIPRSSWNGIIQLGVEHFFEVSKTLDHEINRSQEKSSVAEGETVKFRRPLPVCWEQDQEKMVHISEVNPEECEFRSVDLGTKFVESEDKEPDYVLDTFGMKVHPVTGQPIDTWVDFNKIPI